MEKKYKIFFLIQILNVLYYDMLIKVAPFAFFLSNKMFIYWSYLII